MELQELRVDWRAVVTVVASTLLLTVDSYHVFFETFFASSLEAELATKTLLYLIIPLLVILLLFRQLPARYGMRLGDWRAGLSLTAAACVALAVVVLLLGRTAEFGDYYRHTVDRPIPFWLADGIELVSWEFFFRGFLLFALYRACGPIALVLQAVPFALAHIGKPELETLSCIFGGTAFGYVAWRTQSFLYPFLIHWFLASFTAMVAGGVVG
ncbi:MAG: CPBP family intramembrane metalloprotease [Anaerolineae bacterium]|jgi:membrane protease YdiL (CAAX protease family)